MTPHPAQLSQSSLTDFAECARRFQLRYRLHLTWPAPLAEPIAAVEQDARLGKAFHLLMERHQRGLSVYPPRDPKLRGWWDAFQNSQAALGLPTSGTRTPEIDYSIALFGHRLTARFDLLCIDPGSEIVIVDWKTGRRPSDPRTLWDRLQTKVYLTVAHGALAAQFGAAPQATQLSLVYWFAQAPNDPIRLTVPDDRTLPRFQRELGALIGQIDALDNGDNQVWPLTPDINRCKLCNYRSLCARDVRPANAAQLDDLGDLPLVIEEVEL